MKLTISSETLQKKLSFINHAVSPRTQLPILSTMLLKLQENILTISATDLEIGIQSQIKVEGEENGEIAVPAKLFLDLINSLPTEKITLELKGQTLEVKTKKTKSTLQTTSKDDFPKLLDDKGEEIATLKVATLKKDLQSVLFCASIDTSRPALSGILVKSEDGKFLFVATDGYRLSLKRNSLPTSSDIELLIPARVLKEVLAMKQDEEEIKLYVSKENNQVVFSDENTLLVGRLIDAQFPNFQKIIPSDHSISVEFDREQMHKAVKMCSIFARDSANIVRFSLKKDSIVVSANTPSVGDNIVEVEAKLNGEENEIAFNARYLLDLFANIEENDLVFEMTGPLNPGVFKVKGDSSFLHLIMPIRVQG